MTVCSLCDRNDAIHPRVFPVSVICYLVIAMIGRFSCIVFVVLIDIYIIMANGM